MAHAQKIPSRRGPERPRTFAVIMAGGHSTRFWPLGRRRLPKQLLALTGRQTLLQETAARLVPLVSARGLLVVTAAEHAAEVHRQLPRVPKDNILVEPRGRNTAACIALAAEWITTNHGDGLMLVVPADHVVRESDALRDALTRAGALARQGDLLVLVGMQPTRAETGYGYIRLGGPVPSTIGDQAAWVRAFHEKPARATAQRYVASGEYLWNSGMFAWTARTFLAALESCLPAVRRPLAGVWSDREPAARLRRAYRRLPNVSVDVGVLQPLSKQRRGPARIAVTRAGFEWFDVGSWSAMPELWGCDEAGNAVVGTLVAVDAGGCVVYAPDRLVALVGVRDLVVAESGGALLVCPRDRAQEVREVTRVLEQRRLVRFL